ncbi:aspartate/glutamate racemase family protein [Roseinatronobacter alkalisoli]|uniref:Aspartate/glutamate racemase family protein n=1 Tax=Roseinatronobacter alkalisoli TaxID=3028235 RepID=A0ABT5TCS1_9RHOB|nr:aspartate/glutamate racemase family protein [Roseinatronobacter sp. HJB301]MDD7972923.1 aspartate/glutamate racemase family protein [Roseinatronobacter sp. HJB301]
MSELAVTMPRIALIHALEESVAPIRDAFARLWPEAQIADLLDTSLSADLARAGRLDQAMITRFLKLGRYAALGSGAQDTQAILFTCSAFGPAIDAVRSALSIPVLRPNQAAFAEALILGARIALVVTFPPSLPALMRELQDMASALGKTIHITPILADGALAALKVGDGAGHDAIVLAACKDIGAQDVVLLGQFSLARAARVLQPCFGCPVITTPDSAVRALRRLLPCPERTAS